MSHFTVLVINNETDDVEYDLAPFSENVEKGDDFAEFISDGTIKHFEDEWKNGVEKDNYSDVEEYISDYYGYDIHNGEVGYWGNPNAKWDWYQIGGRWAGEIVIKDDIDINVFAPNFSYGWSEEEKIKMMSKPKRVTDQAQAKYIDWKYMFNQEDKRNYHNRFWELFIEEQEPITDEDKEMIKHIWYDKEYFTETYKDKETYVKCMTSFSTFAVLLDGKWIGKGDMGWFGISSESADEDLNWQLNFYDNFIKDIDPNAYVTVVDCHI